MISQTRKKEILKMRNDDLKIALALAEEKLIDAEKTNLSNLGMKNREISELEKKSESLQNRLNNEVQHLDDIRMAITSIAALRFPGTEFDPASYQPPIPTGYVKVEEPEELLALRHIYSLTGF